jgi:hypothetical protein
MPASLALSIDGDGCTVERLRRVLGYWATDEATEFGRGLGLPIASSMFAYSRNPDAPPQAAYLDGDREGLLEAYRRGWIDTLHGLGDFGRGHPCTRDLARRAYDALAADGVRLRVWTNHGGPENVQNFLRAGSRGDVPGSDAYHADLAREYGIRFVWPSELTHLVGQERPASAGEYYATYPERSALRRWAARAAHGLGEGWVRRLDLEPYRGNELVEPRSLGDGSRILAFRRHGRWRRDTVSLLPEILSAAVLDRLVETGGVMVLYLHIGPSRDETPESFQAGLRAMQEAARRVAGGGLRLERTSDLLARVASERGLQA